MFKRFGLMAAVIWFVLASIGSAALAGQWEDATKAFAKKEYERTLKLLRPLAEKGHALAQYRIAKMHQMGLGVSKDTKEAKRWARLAAKQGNAEAQLLAGSLYYKSDSGESPDVVRAYMWYEASADQGSSEAKKEIAAITKEMTPAQLADAREKAQKCKASKYEQCD